MTNVKEYWKDIPGWEGKYQASNKGRIRSIDRSIVDANGVARNYRGRILTPIFNHQRQTYHVKLSKDSKSTTRSIHVLVMLAHVGPCPEGLEILHGPLGRLNNSLSNLHYGTHVENIFDHARDGVGNRKKVKRSDGKIFNSMIEAANASKCPPGNITNCCKGKYKTSGGFSWSYI